MITRKNFIAYMVDVCGYEEKEADDLFDDCGGNVREILTEFEFDNLSFNYS